MWDSDAGGSDTMKEVQDQKPYIFVCTGKDCSRKKTPEFDRTLKRFKKQYQIIKTNCMDHCKEAPNLVVDNTRYARVSAKDLPKIVNKKAVN
jgi:NADH:ubiquinone oxidoreductase subunit E